MSLTPKIPGVHKAKLPTIYVEAQLALKHCSRIDECKKWADKAAAIASYAKQSQDSTLMDTAVRIRARAIRRCGELLKEIEKSPGGRPSKTRDGADPSFGGRKGAAESAGLSERQRKDALRVASIPANEFEKAVESGKPPSVTQLSEAGKREAANLAYLRSPKPPGFRDATELLGTFNRFAEFCDRADPGLVAEALSKREVKQILRTSETVSAWMKNFKRKLPQ